MLRTPMLHGDVCNAGAQEGEQSYEAQLLLEKLDTWLGNDWCKVDSEHGVVVQRLLL